MRREYFFASEKIFLRRRRFRRGGGDCSFCCWVSSAVFFLRRDHVVTEIIAQQRRRRRRFFFFFFFFFGIYSRRHHFQPRSTCVLPFDVFSFCGEKIHAKKRRPTHLFLKLFSSSWFLSSRLFRLRTTTRPNKKKTKEGRGAYNDPKKLRGARDNKNPFIISEASNDCALCLELAGIRVCSTRRKGRACFGSTIFWPPRLRWSSTTFGWPC